MTMQELSGQYAGTAEVLYQRIAELRKQAAAAADPDDRFHLRRRIDELTPIWREARELAHAQSLKAYKELLDAGALTQEEFDRKKAELLGL